MAPQSCSWCGSLQVGPAGCCSAATFHHTCPGTCLHGTPVVCTYSLRGLHIKQHILPMQLCCPAGCSGGFMPLTRMPFGPERCSSTAASPVHSRPRFLCSVWKQVDALQGLPDSSTPAAAKAKPEGLSSWQTPAPVFPDAPTPATAAPASGWQDIYAGAAGKSEALIAPWPGCTPWSWCCRKA